MARLDVEQLVGRIAGGVVTPGHADYETARRVWNGMIDRRPAVIARCMSAEDVAATIAVAADADVPLAIRGVPITSLATRPATAGSSLIFH